MGKKWRVVFILCVFISSLFILSCDSGSSGDGSSGSDQTENGDNSDSGDSTEDDSGSSGSETDNSDTHEDEDDYDVDDSGTVSIVLSQSGITVDGSGATVSGTTVTISSSGTYDISGTLTDGQVIVDTEDEDTVKIIFDGVNIESTTNAPFAVMNAEKTVITLADDTKNYITDNDDYVFEDADTDEPNAALFSKDDLTICGNGALIVTGNYNDGIASKDGLIIAGGTITVTSVDDGIRGKDYIVMEDGTVSVTADGDGLKSDNDEDADKGYIQVENGSISIVAGGDGMAAETDVIIDDGSFSIKTGGGHSKSISDNDSAKGMKAAVEIDVNGGTISIDAADDAVHSNDAITISGGDFNVASGDDAFHADETLVVNDGDIIITACYEGLEGTEITIYDGNFDITADDDGINIAGGDGSGFNNRPGDNFNSSGADALYIYGGYFVIDSDGDGIDSNGDIEMTDGTVIISGPTSSSDSAIDYDGSFDISGGFLIGAGSYGMDQAPGSGSSQYTVHVVFNSSISSSSLFHIESADGDELVTFKGAKRYQSVVFSSPELKRNETYNIYYGGSSTGDYSDFLYDNGTYSPGTLYTEFTISSIVTKISGNGSGYYK
jgi:hypothetical protein